MVFWNYFAKVLQGYWRILADFLKRQKLRKIGTVWTWTTKRADDVGKNKAADGWLKKMILIVRNRLERGREWDDFSNLMVKEERVPIYLHKYSRKNVVTPVKRFAAAIATSGVKFNQKKKKKKKKRAENNKEKRGAYETKG